MIVADLERVKTRWGFDPVPAYPSWPAGTRFEVIASNADEIGEGRLFPQTDYPEYFGTRELAQQTTREYHRALDAARRMAVTATTEIRVWHPSLIGCYDASTPETEAEAATTLWRLAREAAESGMAA